MNKKRNKSYRSLKNMRRHVEKTKRRQYSNKNKKSTLINVRNNKTKVVEKRRRLRRIVQRGGGGELKYLIQSLIMSNIPEKTQTVGSFLTQAKTMFHSIATALEGPEDELDGRTALYSACSLPIPDIQLVQLLLSEGFNPNVSTSLGMKLYPLHGVVQAAYEIINYKGMSKDDKKERLYKIVEILTMLIEYRSNKNNKDINGNTAFDIYNRGGIFNTESQSLSEKIRMEFPYEPISLKIYDLLNPNTETPPPNPQPPVTAAVNKTISRYHHGAIASYELDTPLDPSQIHKDNLWFSMVFGFAEMIQSKSGTGKVSIVPRVMSLESRSTLNGDRKILKLKISGKEFDAGIPIIESTGNLMEMAQRSVLSGHSSSLQAKTLNIIDGDIAVFFKQRELQGSLFQVASQFNALEMISPDTIPEAGITIYENDRSQGPPCAMACPSGTVYRNYFALPLHDGTIDGTAQTHYKDCQLNMLDDVILYLKHQTPPINMTEQNVYILPSTQADVQNLNTLLGNEVKMMEVVKLVKYFVQEDVPVLSSDNGKEVNRVSQIFCSGLPFSARYSIPITGIDQSSQTNSNIARMILRAVYNATFAYAIKMAETQKKIIKVFLTRVGGGFFGTATVDFIDNIIGELLRTTCSNYPIEVYMVNFKPGIRFEGSPAATPTLASANTSPLPQGWVEQFDSASGKPYYLNTATNTTTWERPTVSVTPQHAQVAPLMTQALPPGWVEQIDSASGKPYYLNTATNTTTWERPALPVTPDQAQPALPPNWFGRYHAKSGRLYYINTATNATTWDRPTAIWRWESDDGSKFIPFDFSDNELLEQAISSRQQLFQHPSRPWLFNFSSMVQTNTTSGSKRNIMRT